MGYLQVPGSIREVDIGDSPGCLCGVTPDGKLPSKLSLDILELGSGVCSSQGPHSLSHGNTFKCVSGNVRRTNSKMESIDRFVEDGRSESMRCREIGWFINA